MCDLAEIYGWPPQVLIHLSIAELLFWRSRGETEISHDRAMRIWERQQRRALRSES